MRVLRAYGENLDGLTIFVKMLDVFVFLAKGLGAVILAATAALLIRLLPARIRRAASHFAAFVIFFALLREYRVSVIMAAYLRLGLRLMAVAVTVSVARIAQALKKRNMSYAHARLVKPVSGRHGMERSDAQAGYFSSFLRRSPIMLQ